MMQLTIYASNRCPNNISNSCDISNEVKEADWCDDRLSLLTCYALFSKSGFWDLYYALENKPKNNEIIQLTKVELGYMLVSSMTHRDYDGTFNSVSLICELYDKFDEMEEKGFKYWLLCTW